MQPLATTRGIEAYRERSHRRRERTDGLDSPAFNSNVVTLPRGARMRVACTAPWASTSSTLTEPPLSGPRAHSPGTKAAPPMRSSTGRSGEASKQTSAGLSASQTRSWVRDQPLRPAHAPKHAIRANADRRTPR